MAKHTQDPHALSTPDLIYRAADILSVTGIAVDERVANALYARGRKLADGNEALKDAAQLIAGLSDAPAQGANFIAGRLRLMDLAATLRELAQ